MSHEQVQILAHVAGVGAAVNIVVDDAHAAGAIGVAVFFQVPGQYDHRQVFVIVKQGPGIYRRVEHCFYLHERRSVDGFRQFVAVFGIVQVHHRYRRFPHRIVPQGDGKDNRADHGYHQGHFLVRHAHAGEQKIYFIS